MRILLVNILLCLTMMIFGFPKKLEIQISQMIEKNAKFSSTEGLFGNGVYKSDNEYKLYNKEHFLRY